MNQIDFLRDRYPDHVIGFSTHEYHDWTSSMLIAYAKGARTFERHIDIERDGVTVSPYCSLPTQVDAGSRPSTRPRRCAARRARRSASRRDGRSSTWTRWCAASMPRRPAGGPHPQRRRRLSGDPAAEGADLLPRIDARRGAAASRSPGRSRSRSTPSTVPTPAFHRCGS